MIHHFVSVFCDTQYTNLVTQYGMCTVVRITLSVQTDSVINAGGNYGGEQLHGFKVYIDGTEELVFDSNQSRRDTTYNISITENITYVVIKRKNILTLCEVEVFAGK